MTFNDKNFNTFKRICSLKQEGVLQLMRHFLKQKYDNVISTPSYIIAIGDIPVGLVAHADTVFKAPPVEFFYDKEKNVIWSPDGLGADDRAGIFAIMSIISAGQRPHIIITTDEERGAIGANKLVSKIKEFPAPMKFMIQLDRRGIDDSVYYDLDNTDFENFINSFGFNTKMGSFSDISILAPVWKIAAVNLSVGYFDEHSCVERLYVDALLDTIKKVQEILQKATKKSVPKYDYVESWHYRWMDYYWEDRPIKEGEAQCQFCQSIEKKENLLPLSWHAAPDKSQEMSFGICNECYSHYVDDIEWCSKCGTGYFLTKKDLENMPKDRTTWVCKFCKEELN